MGLIDLILNLAALLLWLNWRHAGSSPAATQGSLLLSTLRRADKPQQHRWRYLVAMIALVLLRAPVYSQLGYALNWTPKLDLGVIALSFRSDYLGRVFLFSILSFLQMLTLFYISFIFLNLTNRKPSESDIFQRSVRQQLGWLSQWPLVIQIVLPIVVIALLWLSLAYWFAEMSLLPPQGEAQSVLLQGAVIGGAAWLACKLVIVFFLALHLLNSYVYLGNHAFWKYVNATAQNLLRPLSWLPLQFGRIDFTPLLGIGLVLLAAELAMRGLRDIFQNVL